MCFACGESKKWVTLYEFACLVLHRQGNAVARCPYGCASML